MSKPPEPEGPRPFEEEGPTQAPTQAGPEYPEIGPAHRNAGETGRFAPGSIVADRFRIVAPLGKGGMGEVYRAEDLRLGQTVALKFLPERVANHPGPLERLRAEVRVGRQIAHPNVCRIYDLIEADGQHFVAMEYVDGEDLASLLRRIGRLAPDKATELAHQICAGLTAIHEQDIVHRDLKPANIMIDGRGRARITDFGLAVPTQELDPGELAGTPHYMAPEQLTGGGASAKTDLYALGLVLYEMFSGKPPFVAETMKELAAKQRETPPPGPGSSSHSLDQIVLHCLDPDPEQRPPSARAVISAFPGGDPLDRVIADGDTPSPEMVAAAGVVGDLRPAVAWALLLAALGCLVSLAGIAGKISNLSRVEFPKPPEVLIEDARQILAIVAGHVARPLDQAHGFFASSETEAMDAAHGIEAGQRLQPSQIRFSYRQRPGPLVPRAGKYRESILQPGYSDLGPVSRNDPPLTSPGEAEIVVDPGGRLVELRVVASPVSKQGEQDDLISPTWTELLVSAGFEPASLTPALPQWPPPVGSDARFAWQGEYPDQPGVKLRIEAAAFAGYPVWLRVLGPWVEPAQAPRERPWVDRLGEALTVTVAILVLLGALILVRRNLLQGRGDRRGALRLALFLFTTFTAGSLFRLNHLSNAMAEYDLLVTMLAQTTFLALMAWVIYMAIEPFVRRRWPRTLIAWTRLFAFRFRDPIVGRDLLVGLLAGALLVLIVQAGFMLRSGVGIAAWSSTLSSVRNVVYYALLDLTLAVLHGLGSLLLLVLLRALLRSEGRALLGLWLLYTTGMLTIFGFGPVAPLFAGLLVLVLRFGLLSTAAAIYVFLLFGKLPMTLDPSLWYAGRSFAILLLLAALAVFGFYTSLGGKPLFGRDLFET